MTHTRRIVAAILAAALLSVSFALVPKDVPGVPVLSSLEADPASAHDARYPGIPYRAWVCNYEWQHIQVVVGYHDPAPVGWEMHPIYAWKWELVQVCRDEWRWTQGLPRLHAHLTETQCKWGLRVGGVLLAWYGAAAAAARAAGAYAAGSQDTDIDVFKVCEAEDVILWLDQP